MSTASRPLYPKQQKKFDQPQQQPSSPIVEKDGRFFIAVNESEADSYSPNRQLSQGQQFSDSKTDSQRRSLAKTDNDEKNLLSLVDDSKEKKKVAGNKMQKLNKLELDGFNSLAEASSWCARMFWLLLLLIIIGVLTYEIVKTIHNYVYDKVITTYTINLNDSMIFPILYVCPGNYLNDTYYRSHIRESRTAQAFQVSLVNQSEVKSSRPKRDIHYPDPKEMNEWQIDLMRLHELQQKDAYPLQDSDSLDYEEEIEWPFELLDDHVKLERLKRDVSNGTRINGTAASGVRTNVTVATTPMPLLNMTPNQVYNFMLDVGLDSSQVFLSCKFTTDNGEEVIPCSDIVEDVVDVNYGKCYKVSVGQRQQTVEARGLSLIIDTFKSRITKDPNVSKRYNGMFLAVFYEQVNPASWEKIMVSGGTYMNLDVALEHLKLVDLERSDFVQPCVSEEEAILSVINTTYGQAACQLDCFMKQIVDDCNCILMMNKAAILSDVMSTHEFCSKEVAENCIVKKITETQEGVDAVKNCKKKCHVPCESWRYKVTPSKMVLNPLAFDNLPHNITYDDILQLDLSYSRLEYAEIQQSMQTTVDTFIGNLGGQITGWIGGSMLTVINIPIFISKYLILRNVKKARRTLASRTAAAEQNVIGFQNIISAQRSQMH